MGSYQLLEKLAVGGMGEVWRARHQMLAHPAAIKLVRTDSGPSIPRHMTRRRFEREARVTANLRSPNTVRLYDFGVTEGEGAFFYVMELLHGLPLEHLVEQFGPLHPERVIYLLCMACRSLAEAHGAGLVHRDIKPANLFLCQMGVDYDVLKVLDFGVVRGDVEGRPELPGQEDQVVGTPAYISPEAIECDPYIDHRADLYSLGCVAYYLLTGEDVFDGVSIAEVLAHHRKTTPAPPSASAPHPVPEKLDAIVLRCLAKTPSRRPADATELEELLEAVSLDRAWNLDRAAAWWRESLPHIAQEEPWQREASALSGPVLSEISMVMEMPEEQETR